MKTIIYLFIMVVAVSACNDLPKESKEKIIPLSHAYSIIQNSANEIKTKNIESSGIDDIGNGRFLFKRDGHYIINTCITGEGGVEFVVITCCVVSSDSIELRYKKRFDPTLTRFYEQETIYLDDIKKGDIVYLDVMADDIFIINEGSIFIEQIH